MSRLSTKQRRAARRRERAYWARVFPWRFRSAGMMAALTTPPVRWFQLTPDIGLIEGRSEVS